MSHGLSLDDLDDIFGAVEEDNSSDIAAVDNVCFDIHGPVSPLLPLSPTVKDGNCDASTDFELFNYLADCHSVSEVNDDSTLPLSIMSPDTTSFDDSHSHALAILREFGITEEMLASMSTPTLNQTLRRLCKEDQAVIKQFRRTMKNRGYAQSCRLRRRVEITDMEKQIKTLQDEVKHLQSKLHQEQQQNQISQRNISVLTNFITNNISVIDGLVVISDQQPVASQ